MACTFDETVSGQAPVLNHILGTGQSLAIGTMGSPPLTTSQPYGNLSLSLNSHSQQAGTGFVPLIEGLNADGASVETISSALANTLTALSPQTNFTTIVTRDGQGGTPYSGLEKGTAPYALGLLELSNALAAAQSLDQAYQVTAVTCVHGEQDDVLGNGPYYAGYLRQWQQDIDADAKAITGQTNEVPMFLCQMSSWTANNRAATSLIPAAQLYAAETYPSHFLVCPKYFLTYYSDGIHLTAQSYRRLGEYYGKVMKKVLIDGQRWRPLTPDSISISNKNITIILHVPVSPIVNDISIGSKAYYGFEYADDSSSAAISSAFISSSNAVTIVLNKVPSGAHPRLRYAYTGTPGALAGANQTGSARGTIRDSDATASLSGDSLVNWLVHFDYSIPYNAAYPVQVTESSVRSGQSVKIAWQTVSGSSNYVDYATSLTPPVTWSNVYLINGNDPSLVYTNKSIYTTAAYTNYVTQPHAFFRVRIQ